MNSTCCTLSRFLALPPQLRGSAELCLNSPFLYHALELTSHRSLFFLWGPVSLTVTLSYIVSDFLFLSNCFTPEGISSVSYYVLGKCGHSTQFATGLIVSLNYTEFWMLSMPYIPNINFPSHDALCFLYIDGFNLLIFFSGYLCLGSWEMLVCSFPVL